MLNGAWIGFTDNPQVMVDSVKFFRTNRKMSHEVSVVRDIVQKEIKLYTDAGRCMRPLFKVVNIEDEENRNILKLNSSHIEGNLTFEELLDAGVVEFLDV